jgi:hypothetical protein
MARRFLSANTNAMQGSPTASSPADSDSVAVFLTTETTVGVWLKINTAPPAATKETVVSLVSILNSAATAANTLFALRVNDNLTLEIGHEEAGGGNRFASTSYAIPLGKWIYVCVVKTADGGNVQYKVYVNGRHIEDLPSVTNCGNGADAFWQVAGVIEATTPFAPVFLLTDGEMAGIYTWDDALSADAILEDFQRGLLQGFHTSVDIQVYIDNGETVTSGLEEEAVYLEATRLDGLDFVSSLTMSNAPDNAVTQGTVKLTRDQQNLSLAYLKNDTKINFPDPNVTSGPRFLDTSRGIKIYTCRTPLGVRASGRDFWLLLDGTTDMFDWGSDEVSLNFRDKGGVLVDTFIEEELPYGSVLGATIHSQMQLILDANSVGGGKIGSYDSPTLTDSVSGLMPTWAIKSFEQRREPVMVALRTLAGQFGHDVKYRWNEIFEEFRLTLYQPESDSTTPAIIFNPAEIASVSKAEIALQKIRNVVRVSYDSTETGGASGTQLANVNAALALLPLPGTLPGTPVVPTGAVGQDADGNRLPAFVMLEDLVSIAKYGRRFMEVQESSTSHIDLGTEATEMAWRMLGDLSEPEFGHSVSIPITPEIDIHDIIGFSPNEKLYTESQYLAVARVSHTFGEKATTSIDVRGRPNMGIKRWLMLESRSANNPANTPMQAQNAMTKTQRMNPMQSIVDKTHWMAGGKFAQVRNNSFSTWTNGRENPPTSWVMDTGDEWDNDTIKATTTSLTGPLSVAMHEDGGTNPRIDSDLIPLDGDVNVPYCLEVTWQRIAGASTSSRPSFFVKWLDAAFNVVGSSGPLETLIPAPGAAEWHTHRYQGLSGAASAVYAQINMGSNFGGVANEVIVDSASIYRNAYGSRTTLQTTGDWVGTAFSANIKAGGGLNIRASNVSTAGSYDFGENWVDDTSTAAGNHDGTYFDVPVTGYYDVSGAIYVGITPSEAIPWDYWEDVVFPGGSLQVLFNSHIPPVTSTIIPPPPSWTGGVLASINTQYGPTGLLTIIGTPLAQESATFTIGFNAASNRALPGNPIPINMRGLLLTRGDRLSFSLFAVPTAALVYPATDMDISTAGSDFLDPSYIHVKLIEND